MHGKSRTPEETYGPALEKARKAFPRLDAQRTAVCAATPFLPGADGSGAFHVHFFSSPHWVSWPEGSVRRMGDELEADISVQLLLLHYLLTADGTVLADKWIAFRNLPGGLGYDAAFQGRASQRLARTFGSNRGSFDTAAKAMGGERLSFGDASYLFRALPRVWMAVVLNVADEEFPANANILFDAAVSHYLPTEDLAVLGGILAGRLIKVAQVP